jgi:hypothetical protein
MNRRCPCMARQDLLGSKHKVLEKALAFFAARSSRFHWARGAKKPPSAAGQCRLHQEKCSAAGASEEKVVKRALCVSRSCYKCSRGPLLLQQQNYINTNRCRNSSTALVFLISLLLQLAHKFLVISLPPAPRALRSDSATPIT